MNNDIITICTMHSTTESLECTIYMNIFMVCNFRNPVDEDVNNGGHDISFYV